MNWKMLNFFLLPTIKESPSVQDPPIGYGVSFLAQDRLRMLTLCAIFFENFYHVRIVQFMQDQIHVLTTVKSRMSINF
jgi:hypothetical protein